MKHYITTKYDFTIPMAVRGPFKGPPGRPPKTAAPLKRAPIGLGRRSIQWRFQVQQVLQLVPGARGKKGPTICSRGLPVAPFTSIAAFSEEILLVYSVLPELGHGHGSLKTLSSDCPIQTNKGCFDHLADLNFAGNFCLQKSPCNQ